MSVDYSIAAFPTLYRGRQYRSRLEARWAAFFDLLGIKHEYEPYDLGVWSPDFLLSDIATLVEVKPIREIDDDTWRKMTKACQNKKLLEGEEAPLHGVILTMVAPICKGPLIQIGWLSMGYNDMVPIDAYLAWLPKYDVPEFTATIVSIDAGGWYSLCGDADDWTTSRYHRPNHYAEHATRLWAQASNIVQWQGA